MCDMKSQNIRILKQEQRMFICDSYPDVATESEKHTHKRKLKITINKKGMTFVMCKNMKSSICLSIPKQFTYVHSHDNTILLSQ